MLAALAACQPAALPVAVAPAAQSPMPAQDTCGAAPYGYLLGQSGVALERVLILRQVRVLRPGQAMGADVRPARLTFHLAAVPQAPGAAPTRHTTQITAISCS